MEAKIASVLPKGAEAAVREFLSAVATELTKVDD
jgi:hypothetical protein